MKEAIVGLPCEQLKRYLREKGVAFSVVDI